MSQPNPWQRLATTPMYDNPWIRVLHDDVLTPAGRPGIYGRVLFKHKAIGIVPVDADGCTWLVGQYRYPLDVYSWEIPEGGGKLDVEPLVSAQRELREETGLIAAQWRFLQRLHLSNSVTDEEAFLYLATDLTQAEPQPDDTEQLTLRRLPLAEAVALVYDGTITDAMAVVGLLQAARVLGVKG
jgi:8-oxo-dGTP pyrophosphatase MutT (NUDIX family)